MIDERIRIPRNNGFSGQYSQHSTQQYSIKSAAAEPERSCRCCSITANSAATNRQQNCALEEELLWTQSAENSKYSWKNRSKILTLWSNIRRIWNCWNSHSRKRKVGGRGSSKIKLYNHNSTKSISFGTVKSEEVLVVNAEEILDTNKILNYKIRMIKWVCVK